MERDEKLIPSFILVYFFDVFLKPWHYDTTDVVNAVTRSG